MLAIYVIGCICMFIGSYVKLIATAKPKKAYSALAIAICTFGWPIIPIGLLLIVLLGIVLFGINGIIYLFDKDEKRWNKRTKVDVWSSVGKE